MMIDHDQNEAAISTTITILTVKLARRNSAMSEKSRVDGSICLSCLLGNVAALLRRGRIIRPVLRRCAEIAAFCLGGA